MKGLTKSIIVVLAVGLILSVSAVGVLASPKAEDLHPSPLDEGVHADASLAGNVETLNVSANQMRWVIEVGSEMGDYLQRNSDGTLTLKAPNPEEVGVSQSFLNEYEAGLQGINELVRMGWVRFDEDFNIHFTSDMPQEAADIQAGLQQIDAKVAGKDLSDALDGRKVTNFRGFRFNFVGGFHHAPFRSASFPLTFSARFDHGFHGHRFGLLFGGHHRFFRDQLRDGLDVFIPGIAFRNDPDRHLVYYHPFFADRWYITHLFF